MVGVEGAEESWETEVEKKVGPSIEAFQNQGDLHWETTSGLLETKAREASHSASRPPPMAGPLTQVILGGAQS